MVQTEAELEAALAMIEARQGPLLMGGKLDPHDVPRMRI
jgi:hypothetical protein